MVSIDVSVEEMSSMSEAIADAGLGQLLDGFSSSVYSRSRSDCSDLLSAKLFAPICCKKWRSLSFVVVAVDVVVDVTGAGQLVTID